MMLKVMCMVFGVVDDVVLYCVFVDVVKMLVCEDVKEVKDGICV